MMKITQLYPLHQSIDMMQEQPKHIGETVFDSSLHPAEVTLLIELHQRSKTQNQPLSWKMRIAAWCRGRGK